MYQEKGSGAKLKREEGNTINRLESLFVWRARKKQDKLASKLLECKAY